jgi:hypothetical protein
MLSLLLLLLLLLLHIRFPLWRFHSNVTVTVAWQRVCGISIVTQQCGWRRYYGNGVCYIRKSFRGSWSSCERELVEFGRVL